MGDKLDTASPHWGDGPEDNAGKEIERANARLRHFRGVAASVLNEALRLWEEIASALSDSRSCEDILDGSEERPSSSSQGERDRLLEKFHLLGIRIDYARRLCEGSIVKESKREGEV